MNEHLKMADLPNSSKPYEKCILHGAKVLTDTELLATILKTGTAHKNVLVLSEEILSLYPYEKGLLGLHYLTIDDLIGLNGVGKVKAVQIKALAELAVRLSRAEARQKLELGNPSSVAEYYMEPLRHEEVEYVAVMMLDGRNGLIQEFTLSKGTVGSSLVSPREIFKEALKCKAVYIILVHNHPSGDITPSKEDFAVTKRVQKAGELIGIFLIDHIIIGNKKYLSFREKGLL